MLKSLLFNKGDLVVRVKNSVTGDWPPGTLGLLLEPVSSPAPVWRVLVGESGNVTNWTAYNFVRAGDNE